MAVSPGDKPLILTLFSLFLLSSSAQIDIYPSDLRALRILERDLGVNGQRLSSPGVNPCGRRGVFCERTGENVLRITRLVFRSGKLSGFISPAIGRLSELRELTLADNELVRDLPVEVLRCKKLQVLDLRGNRFSGQVPRNLSGLTSLRILDLSSNRFSGNLNFLKNFPNLENLSVANNLFSGKVPEPVQSFSNLRFFDFSGNRFLEGQVPIMNKIKLQSSLQTTRRILAENPSSNSTKKADNSSSEATAEAPTATAKKKKSNKRKKAAAWILGFFVGAIAGSVSGCVISVMFKVILAAIKGRDKTGLSIFSPMIKRAEDLAFLNNEEELASLQIIGRGGCGEVYKAELPGSNGKMIAIKKVIQPSKDAKELAREAQDCSRDSHRA